MELAPNAPAGGFTLLELLVTMTILGLAVGVLYGSLNIGLRSVDAGQEKGDLYQRIRMTRTIIERELTSAYLTPSSSDWTVFLGEEFFGRPGGASPEEQDRRIAIRGEDRYESGIPADRLTFNSFSSYPDGSRILTAVRLMVTQEDIDGNRELLLIRKPLFGPMPVDTLVLAGGEIEGLDMRYLQTVAEEEPEWVDEWDSESELPEAIELDVIWRKDGSLPRITDLPILLHIPERPVR
jgi:prepilin-type N-terminal cleavage/methylation domain-containing protein